MDFVFMLTRADRTVSDCLDVLDDVRLVGLRHIGFKDVGVEPAALAGLHRRMKALGAASYLKVVVTSHQVRSLAARGVAPFTAGSSVFDGSFAPHVGSLRSQLRAVLDACG